MAFARVMVAALRRSGHDPADVLSQAQIAPSALNRRDARITAAQMEALSSAAMQQLDDEALGAFERALPWGSYGMLARASITAPDLRLALRRWCRHHGLLTRALRLELLEQGGVASIVAHEQRRLEDAEAREFGLVHILRNIHGLACWYVDSRIPLRESVFPFAEPAHADAYGFMFPDATLRFDDSQCALRFDARYLDLPLRRDERALQQMLQRALPLTVLQYRRDRLLVQQVRQILAAEPDRGHSGESLAAALHISPRTLHRQLQEEGASLQAIKDEVRCEQARDLLLRTGRPVKQVAAAVGFRNEKSFTRAFRHWTGYAPAAFREAHASIDLSNAKEKTR